MLRTLLPALTGYRCVQIGTWGIERCELARAGTLCQWQIGFGGEHAGDIGFDGVHLPLASASVDAVVIAHGLEQVAEPHRLLRECARVLSERGQMIVMAFNPLSIWALRQGLPSRRIARFHPCSAPPSASRLCDWLQLLEFQPQQLWRYGLGFPFFGRAYHVGEGARWSRSIAWSAQAYAVVARRQVLPRTRIRERVGKRRTAAAPVLARGASRGVTCPR
ncbi:class I SAM-dependent methyltransferase [Salinisphaera aquimarina]|uniref:Class I SAM-dependent methyltransferase n=1 Tax=Salinisphaera aquimarina TaxID=2094031 RepID=A0ABV7ESG8_9GAMM